MKPRVFLSAASMMLTAVTGFAIFMGTPEAPVDRLIENTMAYIKENPSDPMGPYTLGRVHYLALVRRGSLVVGSVNPRGGLPWLYEPESTAPKGQLAENQLRNHLSQAVENFQKALDMDDKNGLFHLGLASVSDAAMNAGFKLGAIPGGTQSPPSGGDFTSLWREQAIAEYLKAYELSLDRNTTFRRGNQGRGTMVPVEREAATRYVVLVRARGVRETERSTFDRLNAWLSTRGARLGVMYITPIIFRLSGSAPLEDLLDSRRTVAFNLDGSGRAQRYTWLRADTGILVWDPADKRQILSGHQLFGSVTFNMFWPDGYRALDALDDSRDGVLRGRELDGLAVWFDRNQDGVSDPPEVVPIHHTGIAAISARATTAVGRSLANEAGLVMRDGRVLPSYDWTTSPLEDGSKRPVS